VEAYGHLFEGVWLSVYMKELGHVSKLVDWSRTEVFIGYVEGAKAYHILDPTTWRVCTVRDMAGLDYGHRRPANGGLPSIMSTTRYQEQRQGLGRHHHTL
jgi:hypothetical protein